MKPLKSRTGPASPIEADAIELLRSVERYQPPAGLKRRVRVRLLESPTMRRFTIMHPAVVTTFILVAAGASAALGRQWSLRNGSAESAAHGLDKQPRTASGAVQVKQPPSSVASSVPAGIDSINEPQNPLEVSDLSPSESPSHGETSAHVDAAPRSLPTSEKELVFDAMRALRREGQPVRAARLLDEYLRRYPKGSLSEEALALAIEAASATGDSRAKGFADRYLASYPTGRFRAAAQRARARFSQ